MSHIDNLISKVISGNCTIAERIEVNRWISLSDENKLSFENKQLLWDLLGKVKKTPSVDVDQAWARFNSLKQEPAKKSFFMYKIAAVAVILLISSVLFFTIDLNHTSEGIYAKNTPSYLNPDSLKMDIDLFHVEGEENETTFIAQVQAKKQEFLIQSEILAQDSSSVDLEPNSILSFLDMRPNQPRIASLSGAGMFDIKPLDKEFILETTDLKIKVQGTKFNIQTPKEGQKFVEISVEEGFMEVYEKANPSNKITITSKQKYIYDLDSHQFIELTVKKTTYSNWKKMVNKIFKKNH